MNEGVGKISEISKEHESIREMKVEWRERCRAGTG